MSCAILSSARFAGTSKTPRRRWRRWLAHTRPAPVCCWRRSRAACCCCWRGCTGSCCRRRAAQPQPPRPPVLQVRSPAMCASPCYLATPTRLARSLGGQRLMSNLRCISYSSIDNHVSIRVNRRARPLFKQHKQRLGQPSQRCQLAGGSGAPRGALRALPGAAGVRAASGRVPEPRGAGGRQRVR